MTRQIAKGLFKCRWIVLEKGGREKKVATSMEHMYSAHSPRVSNHLGMASLEGSTWC
jgi:hypothetical protein